jgi:putative flippase GtrA
MISHFLKTKNYTLKTFAFFNLGGIAFFLSGYAVFALLYGVLHWHWFVAKGLADLVGWSVNYLVQHYLAFYDAARKQGHKKVLKKFVPFSLLNIPLDYAIVGGLKLLGVSPLLGLWLSSLFFTVWKWLWYKHYIFCNK